MQVVDRDVGQCDQHGQHTPVIHQVVVVDKQKKLFLPMIEVVQDGLRKQADGGFAHRKVKLTDLLSKLRIAKRSTEALPEQADVVGVDIDAKYLVSHLSAFFQIP